MPMRGLGCGLIAECTYTRRQNSPLDMEFDLLFLDTLPDEFCLLLDSLWKIKQVCLAFQTELRITFL